MAERNVLVINGNPDSAPGKLSHALAEAYGEGALDAGCTVRHLAVGAIDFSVLRQAEDFLHPARDVSIAAAQAALLAADHVAIIYPLWLGAAPALLKAFLEQVACGGFLMEKRDKGFPRGKLKGRSARVIVTMGMPPLLYRLAYGAHGVKAFNRSILGLAGLGPIRTALFGGKEIEAAGAPDVIAKVRALGRAA